VKVTLPPAVTVGPMRHLTGRKRFVVLAVACGLILSACGEAARHKEVPSSSASHDEESPDPSATPDRRVRPDIQWPKPPEATRVRASDIQPSPTPVPQDNGTIPPSLLGTQWYSLPTTERVVALTFDAGANADGVPSILATLAEADVPATFFLTGKWVEAYPEYAAQIGALYPVANHSYSHPDLTELSNDQVRSEISVGADRIEEATGQDTRPMFRFPFGASDSRTIHIANSLGYGCINWTVDTRGWQGTSGGQSADLIVDRVVGALQPGEIVIMHVGSHPTDGSTLDADALPRVIEELRARGYGFTTIDRYL
jgi:peptidoglycan/xylan/chitin deacetylase (PgdA/CDA1 family)